MIRPVDIAEQIAAVEMKSYLRGLRCWYAYAGIGSTINLAFGRKLRRQRELKNRKHPVEYRRNDPETGVLVWCSWRLDGADGPLASSDNEIPACDQAMRQLVGRRVAHVEISPDWELHLAFTGGFDLSVFPDHVGPDSFDGNWELWRPEQGYIVGRDLEFSLVKREYPPVGRSLRVRQRGQAVATNSRTNRAVKSPSGA